MRCIVAALLTFSRLLLVPSGAVGLRRAQVHRRTVDRAAAARAAAALRDAEGATSSSARRSRPVAQRGLGRRGPESLRRSRLLRRRTRSRSCRTSTTARCRSSAARSIHEQGLLPWRTRGVLRPAAARVREPQASSRRRLRARQHRAVLRHPRALRRRRPRAAARRRQLRRPADRISTAFTAGGKSELFERNRARFKIAPAAADAGDATRASSCSTSLLASNQLAEGVLEADKKAAAGPRVLRRRLLRGVRDGTAGRAGAAAQ